jgi:hypothetical protein
VYSAQRLNLPWHQFTGSTQPVTQLTLTIVAPGENRSIFADSKGIVETSRGVGHTNMLKRIHLNRRIQATVTPMPKLAVNASTEGVQGTSFRYNNTVVVTSRTRSHPNPTQRFDETRLKLVVIKQTVTTLTVVVPPPAEHTS